MNAMTHLSAPDPHTALAEILGIDRQAAKKINYMISTGMQPALTTEQARQLIRCHRLAEMWFEPCGAAKGAEWEWLTQDRPFNEGVAFSVIAKFLPFVHPESQGETYAFLDIPGAILSAKNDALSWDWDTIEDKIGSIERGLRPIVFILKAFGHKF